MTTISSSTARQIGFIGLGSMGRPMAMRLIGGGFTIRCFDIDPDAVEPLAEAGAIPCQSVTEVIRGSEILITMLPDGKSVRNVVLDQDGAAGMMVPGSLLVDMSSSAPRGTRALGKELSDFGIGMIDAPVSGGTKKAADGSLVVMAGGRREDVERVRPILEVLGNRIFHTGELGSGHAVKALNNYVSAAGLAAACEAVLVARAFGVDPDTLVDVLNTSTGRNNTTEVKMKPYILSETFASGFSMALMAKDIRTATDLSKELGCPQTGMAFQAESWSLALGELGQSADHTEMFRFLQGVSKKTNP